MNKPAREMPGEERSTPLPVQRNDDPALMNQVSHSFAGAPIMQLFRHLPCNKKTSEWSEELKNTSQASKGETVQRCAQGL